MLEIRVVGECWRTTVVMVVAVKTKFFAANGSFARCCDTSRHKKDQVVHCASRPAAEVFLLRCWCDSGCDIAAAAAATSVVC